MSSADSEAGLGGRSERTPLLQSGPTHSSTTSRGSINRQILDSGYRPSAMSPVVYEDDDNIVIRQPISYQSTHQAGAAMSSADTNERRAIFSRYRYYSRLDPNSAHSFLMPAHVLPSESLLVIPFRPQSTAAKQSSIITIFSIWNTMMGTSILSMPWAIGQAGFGLGISLIIFIAALALFTAYLVLRSSTFLSEETGVTPDVIEFSDVCRYYLGKQGEFGGIIFSLVALLGAVIVYWVLMSNFLYNTVLFIYNEAFDLFNQTSYINIDNVTSHSKDVYCPILIPVMQNHTVTTFEQVWHPKHTVPFFLILFLVPLINFRSPTFFTKFNALAPYRDPGLEGQPAILTGKLDDLLMLCIDSYGLKPFSASLVNVSRTLSVGFMVAFIIAKVSYWGINVDFSITDPEVYKGVPQALKTFPALTGILSLAYFIHNCVMSIMRNQKNPENNGRDLSIAYFFVMLTYLFIGVMFYVGFPLPKYCIADNFLNNFRNNDIMAFVGRICLFLQMLTVFPLLMFIFRNQVLMMLFNSQYPGLRHVLIFNCCVVTVALLFAVFYPNIGDIIGFAGAICGLAYIFTLPGVIYILYLHRRSTLTIPIVILVISIILAGVLNVVGQIVVKLKAK